MKSRRINWAVNSPAGTPLVIGGAIGDIDDATGAVTLNDRSREVIEEVLEHNPQSTESFIVSGFDLAHEVHRLIQAKHRAGVAVRDRLPSQAREEDSAESHDIKADDLNPNVQRAIDDTLQLLFRHSHQRLARLGQTPDPISITLLRESPLGEDLHWLARVAHSQEQANQDEVFRAVDSVLDLLLWPAGEDRYEVPRAFWSTPLGRILAEARWHVVKREDLMSIGEAAATLHVMRPTIYRWLEDQTLDAIYEEASDRMFVLRDQIEKVKAEQDAADNPDAPLTVGDKGQEISGAARD